MLRLKTLLLLLFFSVNLFAIEVVITTKDINFKEKISKSELAVTSVLEVHKLCTPVSIKDLTKKKYISKRYIKKGSIICTKDIEEYEKKSVIFNFGPIEIEKRGKIIFENDEYIKLKDDDGKVEKIYKDGRLE